MVHKLPYTENIRKEYLQMRAFLAALEHMRERLAEDIQTYAEDIESIEKYYEVTEEDKE